MDILVVSTYPPMVCGVGKYAQQQAGALRREGHRVDVPSPREGGGDLRDELMGGLRPLRLLRYARGYSETYVHYTQFFFFRNESGLDRLPTSLAFIVVMMLAAGRRILFVVHEAA